LKFEGSWLKLNGRRVSRMAPLELWIPWSYMKSRESDVFGDITWRGEGGNQRFLS